MHRKKLLIVESPAKCSTILRYLDSTHAVIASFGHVRELVNSVRAIDVQNKFKMQLRIPQEKQQHVNQLIAAAQKAEHIYLATDQDREGEGIAWHIQDILQPYLANKSIQRITFNEITAQAVTQALQAPRPLNPHLVDAYKARVILDFLVGFHISPLLWSKIGGGNLSAGRVQSPSLRLMEERQQAITSFNPQKFWTLAIDTPIGPIELHQYRGVTYTPLATEEAALELQRAILRACRTVTIQTIGRKTKKIKAPLPLITSTLQQACFQLFKMTAAQTMQVAQKLYEGVPTPTGHTALITYMRTDAFTMAPEAITKMQAYVTQTFGAHYIQEYKVKTKVQGAQEAHEAIRPSNITLTPAQLKPSLTKQQYQVYDLIWKRALAAQMIPATSETQTLTLVSDDQQFTFKHTTSLILIPGWQIVYGEDEKKKPQQHLTLAQGTQIKVIDVRAEHDYTKPPAAYNDASLIKKLTLLGIGRPSTYATIAQSLLKRAYITTSKNKSFCVTPKGAKIIAFLKQHFSDYVNYQFTSTMEKQLDAIAVGTLSVDAFLESFWVKLKQNIEVVKTQQRVVTPIANSACPLCQTHLEEREGRYGTYHCCALYPAKCTYRYSLKHKLEQLERTCPTCHLPLRLITNTSNASQFIGCQGYPQCKYTEALTTPTILCPKCSTHPIVQKFSKSKGRDFYGCQGYPACKNAYNFLPVEKTCPCKATIMLQVDEYTFKCTQCGQSMKEEN